MANNGKDTKLTRHIYEIIHFVINGEDFNSHTAVRCDVVIQVEDIGTKIVRQDILNPKI